MDLIGTKVVVAVLFGLIRFAFGILPIQICSWLQPTVEKNLPPLQNHPLIHNGLVLAECFSGGVFFATCFLYMMPEVHHSVAELMHNGVLHSHYPYSQLTVSLGFFLIYFLEEFCHWLITITPKTPYKCKRLPKIHKDTNGVITVEQLREENVGLKNDSNEKDTENVEDENNDERSEGEELNDLLEEEVRTNQQVLRCVLLVTAFSLHSLFEGLAIGLQHSVTDIWYIFTAISVHAATELFYIGLMIFLRGVKVKIIVIRMFFLALSSPLGVLIGLILTISADTSSGGSSLAAVLLEGISAGTILYITFIEILGKEKERRTCRRIRAIVIGAGFCMMAGLVCIT